MQTWNNFYKGRVNREYFHHVCTKYGTFIDIIRDEIKTDSEVVVETGCGICSVTRALRENHNYFAKFIAIDKSKEMLELSLENLASANIQDVDLRQGDILNSRDIPKGTIAHSHGVLEHFTNFQIQRIIEIQKSKFKTMIHYVPSIKYGVPSFGDERLMSAKKWKEIAHPDQVIEFNDGYDLALIWRQ